MTDLGYAFAAAFGFVVGFIFLIESKKDRDLTEGFFFLAVAVPLFAAGLWALKQLFG